jgi:hypothetical protein
VDGRDKPGHDEEANRCAYFFTFRFLAVFLVVFFGTFAPAALASDRPIAIACLRLVTFRPERPLLNVPALRSFIARSTLADAFFEYFRTMLVLLLAQKLIGASREGSSVKHRGVIGLLASILTWISSHTSHL